MRKLILAGTITILSANFAVADEAVWPPSEADIENKVHLMDKTFEHPENIKKGVTLFITSYNNRTKSYNMPIVYGKIEKIQKNRTVNGVKCDAFTNDSTGQYGWKCLDKLKNPPLTTNDNLYLTRFDDPAFNGGKPLKATPPKEEFLGFTENKIPACDDKRLDKQFAQIVKNVDNADFVSTENEKEVAFDQKRKIRICQAMITSANPDKRAVIIYLLGWDNPKNTYVIQPLK